MKRLTDEELITLLDDIESARVERKESLNKELSKSAREAVCAFSNDMPNYNQPGVLFIGARDNGEPSGITINEKLINSLSDMKTDGNILPMPVMTVEKRCLKGVDIAVVTVLPSDMPPVQYKGRTWIRIGARKALANAQEERVLNEKRRHKILPFDLYPIPSATTEDLSRRIFENDFLPLAFDNETLNDNGRPYELKLASCKMVSAQEENTPTVMGLLALGKRPQDFLPGAYIQFLRIDGTQLTDPVIDEEKITGAMVELLNQAEVRLKAHNREAVDITSSARHQISRTYPLAAIHQILYNAVQHRTYEETNAPIRINWFNDRIEITSPGGPYGNVTEENFMSGITDYRNPNISAALKIFGFVQSFGRGIAIARKELKNNGNPDLQYEVNQTTVLCKILR